MNILFLIGVAIFLGTISGKLFQKLKIPQVVGYIILGVIIGKSFLHFFEGDSIKSLTPLVNFTLGIIGCVIGAELKGSVFKKHGMSIYSILIAEGMFAFIAVAALVTLLTKKLYLGLILGAIASATDPASTINVLWEYKAKGPVTRTLTSIIALDDGLALVLYGLVSVFSKSMIMHKSFSIWEGVCMPVIEIFECLLLGVLCAIFVVHVIKHIKEDSLVISFILGIIAACVGLSMYLHLDLILSSMALGTALANIIPKISEKLIGAIKEMTTSLYILFFVAIGAQLDIHTFVNFSILGIVVVYLFARSFGKIFGAMFGGFITNSPKHVTNYTGLCLFTQGGVAMGLALSINHNLMQLGADGEQVGLLIINVVAATTFVVQLIGPPLVKYGIFKSDEAYRNVTKEDIIESLNIADVMNKDFVSIPEGTSFNAIVDKIKRKDTFNFAVTNRDGVLLGIITMQDLKDALFESELHDIILAKDIAVPSRFSLTPADFLSKAFDIFSKRDLAFVPVVDSIASNKIVGIVDLKLIEDKVNKALFERHDK